MIKLNLRNKIKNRKYHKFELNYPETIVIIY